MLTRSLRGGLSSQGKTKVNFAKQTAGMEARANEPADPADPADANTVGATPTAAAEGPAAAPTGSTDAEAPGSTRSALETLVASSTARKRKRGSSSRYMGVGFDPVSGLWDSRVMVDGTRRLLGWFASEEDAARAVLAVRSTSVSSDPTQASGQAADPPALAAPQPVLAPPQVLASSCPPLRKRQFLRLPAEARLVGEGSGGGGGRRVVSRFVGVTWDKANRKWKAKGPAAGGKQRELGRFLVEEDAARAYDAEAARLGKPFK